MLEKDISFLQLWPPQNPISLPIRTLRISLTRDHHCFHFRKLTKKDKTHTGIEHFQTSKKLETPKERMSILAANSHVLWREFHHQHQNQQHYLCATGIHSFSSRKSSGFWVDFRNRDQKKTSERDLRAAAFWPELSRPSAVEMEPINDCDHLDRILSHAREISQPILIDWYFSLSLCRALFGVLTRLESWGKAMLARCLMVFHVSFGGVFLLTGWLLGVGNASI